MPDRKKSGLSDNSVAAIAYLTPAPALFFLAVQRYNKRPYVRFHAWQSIVLSAFTFLFFYILKFVLSFVPFLGPRTFLGVLCAFFLAVFLIWLWCVVGAMNGKRCKLPIIGEWSEEQASSNPSRNTAVGSKLSCLHRCHPERRLRISRREKPGRPGGGTWETTKRPRARLQHDAELLIRTCEYNGISMQCTLWNILMGYFIGCMFGVGCAFAVLYTIYLGGYRKAVRDGMSDEKPPRFRKAVEFNRRHAARD